MKSMKEIRDEEAATYAEDPLNYWESAEDKFKAGWDARNKIDNEALNVAIKSLNFIHNKLGSTPFSNNDRWGYTLEQVYKESLVSITKIKQLRGIE